MQSVLTVPQVEVAYHHPFIDGKHISFLSGYDGINYGLSHYGLVYFMFKMKSHG